MELQERVRPQALSATVDSLNHKLRYETYQTSAGYGYRVFDASGHDLVNQRPTQNVRLQGMSRAEAEADARAALAAVPVAKTPANAQGFTFETFLSDYGIGYRIFTPNGKVWLEQPFAPGLSGYAGMTQRGAEFFAKAVIASFPAIVAF